MLLLLVAKYIDENRSGFLDRLENDMKSQAIWTDELREKAKAIVAFAGKCEQGSLVPLTAISCYRTAKTQYEIWLIESEMETREIPVKLVESVEKARLDAIVRVRNEQVRQAASANYRMDLVREYSESKRCQGGLQKASRTGVGQDELFADDGEIDYGDSD